MAGPWPRRIAIAAAAAAIAGGLYLMVKPQPVRVDLETIGRGVIEVTIDEEGETRVKDVYRVFAPIAGKVERLTLDAGDRVARGEVVARVRPADPPIRDVRTQRELAAATKASAAAVRVAEAELAQARSSLAFAELDLDRASRLSRTSVISERSLDQARLEVNARRAQVQQAEATLELRQRDYDSARARETLPTDIAILAPEDQCCVAVSAPVSGVVLAVVTQSEQVVQAGTELVQIGAVHDLEVAVDLLSPDAVAIEPGTPARIVGWGGEGELAAVVRRIDPAGFTKVSALGIEEQRVSTVLDLADPPERWQRLGHGFRVFVRIVTFRGDDLVRVPIGSLFRKGEQWAVYRVVDGIARHSPVELGHFSRDHAEVRSGLAEGDTVVVYPSDAVADGTPVVARDG